MSIKRLIFILSILVITIGNTWAQDTTEQKLIYTIGEWNDKCDFTENWFGVLKNVAYDKDSNNVTFTISTNTINLNEKERTFVLNSIFIEEKSHELLNLIKEADAGVILIYVDSTNGKTLDVILTPEEIKEIYPDYANLQKKLKRELAEIIKPQNDSMPITIRPGMTATSMIDDGQNVIVTYSLDENIFNIDDIDENKSNLKKALTQQIDQNILMYIVVEKIRALKQGLIYRFIGNITGKQVDIELNNYDLWKL